MLFARLTHAIGLNDLCDWLRLNLHGFLPNFAIVDTAGHDDNKRAREVCAGIGAGEIVIFDKAYVDFLHLAELD